MNNADWVQTIGQVVTAIGVLVAAWQLRQAKKQAITDFEDQFPREYRELSRRIPLKAFFRESLNDGDFNQAMPAFFHYIDLCNEQIFLRQINRVSEATWLNWCRGIESNLKLPAFQAAWHEIKAKTNSYAELRRLEKSQFQDDPIRWGRDHLPSASAERIEQIQKAA